MKPQGKRGPVNKVEDVMALINQKLSVIKEAQVFMYQFPTVQGFGNTSGFEFIVQDRTGGPLDRLANTAYGLMGALMQRKEIAYAFTMTNSGLSDNTCRQSSRRSDPTTAPEIHLESTPVVGCPRALR